MTGPAKRRAAPGFTILELMITISVIAILATIAIPKLGSMLRSAREGGTRGNLGSVRSALSIYYADTEGQYPGELGSLTLAGRYLGRLPQADAPPYHPKSDALSEGPGTSALDDSGGWAYSNDPGQAEFGRVWVNCTHTDTKGSVWSAY